MLAGSVDLDDVLARLATNRLVFHSEADFQHAFAWQIHLADPALRVRLETQPAPGLRLDLLVSTGDGRSNSAIELKYLTRTWVGEVAGERFALKNHGAQDIRCYDVVKDVQRVESLVAARPGWNGAVVCLTNDPSYWRVPGHGRATNADAFRLHEGSDLSGTRSWGPLTGAGTSKGRETAISLAFRHVVRWRDFSRVDNLPFRVLVIQVPAP